MSYRAFHAQLPCSTTSESHWAHSALKTSLRCDTSIYWCMGLSELFSFQVKMSLKTLSRTFHQSATAQVKMIAFQFSVVWRMHTHFMMSSSAKLTCYCYLSLRPYHDLSVLTFKHVSMFSSNNEISSVDILTN